MKDPGPRKRVADLIYWLLWYKMPAKDVEDLINHTISGDYSSTEKPTYRNAQRLADILWEGEN